METMNIYAKLAKVRSEFKKANIKMSGENKYVGYKYFDLSDILPTTTELELKYGIVSVVNFEETLATLTMTDVDNIKEHITFTTPMSTATLKGCHEVQNLGAVESYLRRYLYLIAYEIVETEQLDLTQGSQTQNKPNVESKKEVVNEILSSDKQAKGEPYIKTEDKVYNGTDEEKENAIIARLSSMDFACISQYNISIAGYAKYIKKDLNAITEQDIQNAIKLKQGAKK